MPRGMTAFCFAARPLPFMTQPCSTALTQQPGVLTVLRCLTAAAGNYSVQNFLDAAHKLRLAAGKYNEGHHLNKYRAKFGGLDPYGLLHR